MVFVSPSLSNILLLHTLHSRGGEPINLDTEFGSIYSDISSLIIASSDPNNTSASAFDVSVFEDIGQLYLIWSGWQGEKNGEQDIFISRMKNPWTTEGERVMLSAPEYDWEKN